MTLRLSSFSAVPDGVTDNTERLNDAFAFAKSEGQDLVIPAGRYAYSDVLSIDGINVTGEKGAAFVALNPLRAALFAHGSGAMIAALQFTGAKPPTRGTTRESCRVVAMSADHFTFANLVIDSCAGAGIRADRSSTGQIIGNSVIGSLADSIHITDRSIDLDIERNTIDQSGDDGIAVVSYVDQGGPVSRIHAEFNRVTNSRGGRGMSIIGGSDIVYLDNFIDARVCGLMIAQENSYRTFGVHKALISRMTLLNCGNPDKDHPAVLIMSDGSDANSDITVERLLIETTIANKGGIRVYGPATSVMLDSNLIKATPELRLDTKGVIVKPYADGPVGVSQW